MKIPAMRRRHGKLGFVGHASVVGGYGDGREVVEGYPPPGTLRAEILGPGWSDRCASKPAARRLRLPRPDVSRSSRCSSAPCSALVYQDHNSRSPRPGYFVCWTKPQRDQWRSLIDL